VADPRENSERRAAEAAARREGATFSPVSLGDFIDADVPRRKWAVEGVWAEGTSGTIAGPPKAGKSTLSLELAVSLATRTPFLGLDQFPVLATPARVTYIQAENSDERVRRDLDLILEARGLGAMEEVLGIYEPYEPIGERFVPSWPAATGEGDWEPDLMVLSHPGMDVMDPAHQDWLMAHAADRDYLFLDPIYLLASANPNDMGQVMELTQFLSRLRDEAPCAVVYTHQLTDKSSAGSAASRLLGSTLLHGWYESALFTKRSQGGMFTVHVDSLREMGEETTLNVAGLGVGEWLSAPGAQGAEDSAGRDAPRVAEKLTGWQRLSDLEADEPDLTNQQYADRLDTSASSIQRWRREAAKAAPPGEA
jgi:AAA domain